jgi:NhaP-type Na+/H+ or K+/H+ antiporter
MMLMCPYVSYLIAEGLELSGIVAILTNGIFLSYYAAPNISLSGRKVLKIGYETIAFTSETLVFVFLGMGMFAFSQPYQDCSIWFILTTIVNLNIARALNIFSVTWFVNKTRSPDSKIGIKMQIVMWISGLRGAMAYALALKAMLELEVGGAILIDTLIYSLITILFIGSALNPILEKMGVKNEETEVIFAVTEDS